MQKLFEHDFWQKWLKFYNKKDLYIQIGIIYNVKTSLCNLCEIWRLILNFSSQVSNRRKIQGLLYNQRKYFYCRKFSAFVVVVII